MGRFNENKNHKFLVDVFEKVLEKEKDALLLLIGEGETMDDVKKQVSEKGIKNDANITVTDDMLNAAAENADTAIVTIGRYSSEGSDRSASKVTTICQMQRQSF